ncbi:sugar transporter ERD6-like 10 isoform X2 [Daucus carota subsp. sativus]|uniref:sugar transporter ERD6-like 10 isoform X2 n=1 Tax=Daucus carota subsp. sativus TaxID=79200 RepID=UPI003083BFF7
MERESMEEGLINKFMSKDDIKINDVASSSVTPLLLFSAGLSGLAAFSNGCAFGYTSAAEAGIMEDLNLSIAQFSLFGSLLNFGGMFGAISSGKIADLMGRKLTMLLMDVSLIIGWSAIIFAQDSTTHHQLSEPRFMEMFEKKYARSLIVVIGTLILLPLGGGQALVFYASLIFKKAGASVIAGTTAYAIIQIPVCAMGALLLDRTGTHAVLLVSLISACLGSFLAALTFVLQDLNQWKELTSTLVLIFVLATLFSLAVGGSVPWVLMGEMLPINIKGFAGSLGTFSSMFVGWIVNYVFNFLLEWSPSGTLFIIASFSGLTILFVAKMIPETKGRTLEEIEASMLT